MVKLNTGTASQAMTGILINCFNASTTARGVKVDLGTTGTGVGLEVTANNASTSSKGILSKNAQFINGNYAGRFEYSSNAYTELIKNTTANIYGVYSASV